MTPDHSVSVERAHCNDVVVAHLEHFLALARAGRAGYVVIALAAAPNSVKVTMAGAVPLEAVVKPGLERLVAGLEALKLNRTPPEPTILSADHVCFNMARGPFSFDFLTWLLDAEMTRVREDAPAPLKVAFWPGRDGNCAALKVPVYRQMFDNVMRPALALVGAVEDDAALGGRCKETYTTDAITRAVLAGEPVARVKSPFGPAGVSQPPVTITLRETSSWPHRNSNVKAWLRFANYLHERGEYVVIVRDTAMANDRSLAGLGYEENPLASVSLLHRVSLYESAKANLFVSNGPAQLALFGERPFLVFVDLQPDGHPYHTDTPAFWREHMGIEAGGQFPWQLDKQRLVWAKDDYENIVRAWEELGL